MKSQRFGLIWVLSSLALGLACSNRRSHEQRDRLAEIILFEHLQQDYDSYDFAVEQQDGSFSLAETSSKKSKEFIKVKVPTGTYKISLNYYKDRLIVFGSRLCGPADRNEVQTLKEGLNLIELTVCNAKAEAIKSKATISPGSEELSSASSPNAEPAAAAVPPKPSDTFTIHDGNLYDRIGKPFIMRGISMPFAYYFDLSLAALDNVKTQGFNTVRIVWCADNYQDSGLRCQPKDFRPAADLDRVITKIIDLRLVPVFNLQNATGQDTTASLQAMADYMLRDDVKAVLLKHKGSLIINIANEWMGSWNKDRVWVDGYKAVIRRLRAAGLPEVLIVDARGYGQDFSSIEESAAELLNLDKNLLFSSHMYAVYASDQVVTEKLSYVRSRKIPYIIGEFGCSHYDDSSGQSNPVACDAILRETASSSYPIGHIAWSYSGNRLQDSDLDAFSASDWLTPTSYGARILSGPYGIKATSKQACFFDSSLCR